MPPGRNLILCSCCVCYLSLEASELKDAVKRSTTSSAALLQALLRSIPKAASRGVLARGIARHTSNGLPTMISQSTVTTTTTTRTTMATAETTVGVGILWRARRRSRRPNLLSCPTATRFPHQMALNTGVLCTGVQHHDISIPSISCSIKSSFFLR